MANDAVIDAGFDFADGMINLLTEFDRRVIVRTAIQLAVKATKTNLDDIVVAAAAKVADAIAPNEAAVKAFMAWLRQRAKGVFASTATLPAVVEGVAFGSAETDAAAVLAEAAALNWAEA